MTANETNKSEASLEQKLEDLWTLVDDIEIAMLTTRLPDGSLVSRPMATIDRHGTDDIWFMTNIDAHKVEEIERDPHVNVAYLQDGEWVSVAGVARVVTDRALIHELYKPDWKAWLGDEGGVRDGSADDPRIALLEIEPESVMYFKRTASKPAMMFKVAKGIVTGEQPDVGEQRYVDASELR